MKRLYLIRHAKSSWKDQSLADFDRPLNKRGKRDAPFMGQRLASYQVTPDLLMSSPAKRALTTAKTIAEEIGYPPTAIVTEPSIYGAGAASLLTVIQAIKDAAHEVMLVGHNPGLTTLAESLTNTMVDNIPTCGIFCVDLPVESWTEVTEGIGTVVFFDYPKKHR
ncbi:histidine phosphatase family protein [candidate division KSB3 bacterium]|uniref:Histidine phosphatase family protein n=1 Tax=candidate division KSB3 bacterium TaxID=2044937 RepID=A0A9D5Q6E9_9BACT|nr:histidine phosphatase family protein [candidate division KSB3 bacterium]MBD3325182.1 histidine phosphatase family protein [candidate division KSB3 bacterium]